MKIRSSTSLRSIAASLVAGLFLFSANPHRERSHRTDLQHRGHNFLDLSGPRLRHPGGMLGRRRRGRRGS